jgi:hypothetical protein
MRNRARLGAARFFAASVALITARYLPGRRARPRIRPLKRILFTPRVAFAASLPTVR